MALGNDGGGGGSWLCSPWDVHGFCGEHSDPFPWSFVVKASRCRLKAVPCTAHFLGESPNGAPPPHLAQPLPAAVGTGAVLGGHEGGKEPPAMDFHQLHRTANCQMLLLMGAGAFPIKEPPTAGLRAAQPQPGGGHRKGGGGPGQMPPPGGDRPLLTTVEESIYFLL